jgi:hypothetical protein
MYPTWKVASLTLLESIAAALFKWSTAFAESSAAT